MGIYSTSKGIGLAGILLIGTGCTPYILLPDEVARLRTDVTAIRNSQEETTGTLAASARQQAETVQQLNATVAALRGRLDRLEEDIEILQQQLTDMMQWMTRHSTSTMGGQSPSSSPAPIRSEPVRPPEAPKPSQPIRESAPPPREMGPSPVSKPEPPQPKPQPAQSKPEPQDDAVSLYGKAYGKFRENDFEGAISAFQSLLDQHPQSDLADNALFWIGESYVEMNRLSAAEKAFRDTATRFPNGNKVPDALYRLGECLLALNRKDEAVSTWRDLMARFPEERAALKAKEKLQSL